MYNYNPTEALEVIQQISREQNRWLLSMTLTHEIQKIKHPNYDEPIEELVPILVIDYK